MSEYFSKDRIKCPHFFGRHKKAYLMEYYLSNKIRFKHLDDLVYRLKCRCPNLPRDYQRTTSKSSLY